MIWVRMGLFRCTYRSQKRVHQTVHLVRRRKVSALQHTHRQIGDHHQVLSQHLLEYITEPIIVFQAPDLRHHAGLLKRFVVQLVYEGEVWVGHHHIGQLLNVSQSMRQSIPSSRQRYLPTGLRLL